MKEVEEEGETGEKVEMMEKDWWPTIVFAVMVGPIAEAEGRAERWKDDAVAVAWPVVAAWAAGFGAKGGNCAGLSREGAGWGRGGEAGSGGSKSNEAGGMGRRGIGMGSGRGGCRACAAAGACC